MRFLDAVKKGHAYNKKGRAYNLGTTSKLREFSFRDAQFSKLLDILRFNRAAAISLGAGHRCV